LTDMRIDWAKRAFTAVLMACLGLLVLMCAEGSTIIRWTAEVANPRQNESLFLESRGDGVIFIGGEGKLYGTDMQALVEGNRYSQNDVTDIIIGSGITEIGFNAVRLYEGVQSIWLGPDVRTIGNGAIRECPNLRYIFLPKGLARAGKDFLFDCEGCMVITDGPAEDLPRLRNVKKDMIYGDVDSYDALVAALGPDVSPPEILRQWWQ